MIPEVDSLAMDGVHVPADAKPEPQPASAQELQCESDPQLQPSSSVTLHVSEGDLAVKKIDSSPIDMIEPMYTARVLVDSESSHHEEYASTEATLASPQQPEPQIKQSYLDVPFQSPVTLAHRSSTSDSPAVSSASSSAATSALSSPQPVAIASFTSPAGNSNQFHTTPISESASSSTSSTPAALTPSTSSLSASKDSASFNATRAKEEELISILSKKKKSLLSEIGSLLTLRDRLCAEADTCSEQGVPFDYSVRFASSPQILKALEIVANAFRREIQNEKAQKVVEEKKQARKHSHTNATELARPNTAPASTSAPAVEHPTSTTTGAVNQVLYSTIPFDSPNLTPIHTPSRDFERKERQHMDKDSKVKRVIFAPETNDNESEDHKTTSTSRGTNSFIEAEESVYLDQVLDCDLEQPLIEPAVPLEWEQPPQQQTQQPKPFSTAPPVPFKRIAPFVQQMQQQQQLLQQQQQQIQQYPASARTHSATAAQSSRQHPLPSRPATAASGSRMHAPPAPRSAQSINTRPSTSVSFASPPPSFITAAAAASRATPSPSTDHNNTTQSFGAHAESIGYLARKNLLLRQAEKESLEGFSNLSLLGVAADCRAAENQSWEKKAHYLNFTPNPPAKHEATFGSRLASTTSPVVVSPARPPRHALNNLTNQQQVHQQTGESANKKSSYSTTPMSSAITPNTRSNNIPRIEWS